ncbi:MAG: hypothetical protein ABIU05_09750, partial [Nitrospirales bacterium]
GPFFCASCGEGDGRGRDLGPSVPETIGRVYHWIGSQPIGAETVAALATEVQANIFSCSSRTKAATREGILRQCGWVIFNSLSSSGLGWSTDKSGHFLEVIDSLNLMEIA